MTLKTLTRSRFAIIAGVLGVAGMLVATTAYAQRGPRGRGPGFGAHGFGPGIAMMRGLRQLDLTETQRGQIKAVMEQNKGAFQPLMERAHAARQGLQDAVTAETFDEAAIRVKSDELAAVQAELAVQGARVHWEVFQLLTPEQQAKAQSLRAERKDRTEERRQRRHERMNER